MARPSWLDTLTRDLSDLEAQALRRTLAVVDGVGREIRLIAPEDVQGGSTARVNLASNDYLALAGHPRIVAAVIDATRRCGYGSGASRLVTGHRPEHAAIERRFAAFKHAEAALLCPSGYMANHAAITALLDSRDDLILLDKLNHASLIDAARATPARMRVFPHLHYAKLARLLRLPARRKLIVTDSVFSMDGDTADLAALCDLADRHDAALLVDEAHGTGVLGPTGAGLAEAQDVAQRVDITISTASKALGGLGGVITGPRHVIEWIVNRARSFIYTTAVPAAQAAAIGAALDVLVDEPQRRERLAALCARLHEGLVAQGWPLPGDRPQSATAAPLTPIFPLVVGQATAALALAEHLANAGFHAPAIRPPTVAPDAARVRVSLRADLEDQDVERLLEALADWRARTAAR